MREVMASTETPFERARRMTEQLLSGMWPKRALEEGFHKEILSAIDAELRRRRRFEEEANQLHAEKILLRNECARLRNAVSTLANFLDTLQIAVPNEVQSAAEALFPKEVD